MAVSQPALACLGTAAGTVDVCRFTWRHIGRPGARLWIATVATIGVWALSYGVGLLIFDPTLRPLFEIPMWLGAAFSVPLLPRDVATALDVQSVASVDITQLLTRLRTYTTEQSAEGTVETTAPETLSVQSSEDVLWLVLTNAVENAVVHHDGVPHVTLAASETENGVEITVADEGAGVPPHELAPIDLEAETALEHGSGLGLWLMHWGATVLGGDLHIDTGDEGTTVSLSVPHWEATEQKPLASTPVR